MFSWDYTGAVKGKRTGESCVTESRNRTLYVVLDLQGEFQRDDFEFLEKK